MYFDFVNLVEPPCTVITCEIMDDYIYVICIISWQLLRMTSNVNFYRYAKLKIVAIKLKKKVNEQDKIIADLQTQSKVYRIILLYYRMSLLYYATIWNPI